MKKLEINRPKLSLAILVFPRMIQIRDHEMNICLCDETAFPALFNLKDLVIMWFNYHFPTTIALAQVSTRYCCQSWEINLLDHNCQQHADQMILSPKSILDSIRAIDSRQWGRYDQSVRDAHALRVCYVCMMLFDLRCARKCLPFRNVI